MKQYGKSGILGVFIGLVISLIMSALFSDGTYLPVNPHSTMGTYYVAHFNQVTTLVIAVLIWFLIGLLFQAADGIFYQEWSLLRMTVTHFMVTVIGFTGLGILAGWFPFTLGYLVFFFLVYIAIYALIYWTNYQKMQRLVQEINTSLEN